MLSRVGAKATAASASRLVRPALPLPHRITTIAPALSSPFSTSRPLGANGNSNSNSNNNNSATPRSTRPPTPPKTKIIKSTKPSSKVNARTSRLLRSQLVIPDKATRRADEAAVQEDDEHDEQVTAALDPVKAATAWATDADQAAATSMPRLQEANAFATASAYDFQLLIDSGRLPPDWRLLEDGQVIYLPSWPVHQRASEKSTDTGPANPSYSHPHVASGEVFILRTGAYVTWGINEEQARRFRSFVLAPRKGQGTSVERGTYEDIGEEEMDFVANDDEITRIVGDVLVIGQAPVDQYSSDDPWSPLLARLSFSAGLALSARLSSQEASLQQYLASVQSIPRLLEQKGRVPIGRKEVVRKMGRLLKLRQMVNLEEGSKAEELELFWENAMMEQHYDSICLTLDIEPRFRSLNEQLDHAENLLDTLRALLTEGSSHRMELVIIALIAIEVTLALISHGYLYNPFAAEEEETHEHGHLA